LPSLAGALAQRHGLEIVAAGSLVMAAVVLLLHECLMQGSSGTQPGHTS
jgi:hypothetical protein